MADDNCFSVFVLLILLQTSLTLAVPGTCIFPSFSHNDKEALSWIEDRDRYEPSPSQNEATQIKWSKNGRIRPVLITETTSALGNESDQFLNWLHKEGERVHTHMFFYRKSRPKIKHDRESTATTYSFTAVAARDLEAGDTLLEIPVHYCLSDEISKDDPTSLRESPWELRIATKILRERAKSVESHWYLLIRSLPTSLRLPLFFSEAELNNTEDDFIIREINALRTFAERSFLVLNQQETAGASFSEFAWALGLVYAFSCKKTNLIYRGELGSESVHLLIPFLGIPTDASSTGASIELDAQKLRIFMGSRAVEGSALYCDFETGTSQYSFLFHGFVAATPYLHDGIDIFENLESLVGWYLSTYEERRHFEKTLLMKRIESEIETFDSYLANVHMGLPWSLAKRKYFVGMDGYISAHLVYALYYLFRFESSQTLVHDVGDMGLESIQDGFLMGNHTIVSSELVSICRSRTSHVININCRSILTHALMALKKRLCGLMHDSSIGSDEDEALLMASLWEGFSDDSGSHLCDTCQWQTEELSLNDYLAIQLRVRRKEILHEVLSVLSLNHEIDDFICTTDSTENLYSLDVAHTEHNEEFMKWCRTQGAQISEKLAVVHFTGNSNLSNPVRGVQAVEDIEQGETLCILPLKMGLFKKASSLAGADSWHLAAANLLYEKALGTKSKWHDYISILPKKMQTPIYLKPNELREIQWWPVLREVIQVRRAIKSSYSRLKERELKGADFEEYKWAAVMVHSRAFTLPVEDDDEYAPYVLMPFMDMINHHYEYQADWMSVPVNNGNLEIVAKRHIKKRQEVFASFGPRSNDNLFLYYGFVLENNPFDTAEIFASFQDAVYWLTVLWQTKCDVLATVKETEDCVLKLQEEKWVKAQRAIEDYSAGVTEQRPEWWTLVNMWADYGYEYMQFQPSPSIYVNGIVDPTLLVALEAVADTFVGDISPFGDGEVDARKSENIGKPYQDEFFTCIEESPWRSSKWALHSSVCSSFLSRTISAIDERSQAKFVVKVSLFLRCIEVLNSMPTTLTEDRLLLVASNASMHVQLAREYRYMKKRFIKQFIDGIATSFKQ